jgi:hypothetical protein
MPSEIVNLIHDRGVGCASHVFKALTTENAIFAESVTPDLWDITVVKAILVFGNTQLFRPSLPMRCDPTIEFSGARSASDAMKS